MNDSVERAASWVYQGVWGILTRWLKVSLQPPELPVAPGDKITMLRPSSDWLRCLKVQFWISMVFVSIFNVGLTIGLIALMIAVPWAAIVLFLPYAIVEVLPAALSYLSLHLRYDTTWYVLSSRSMRIRRGIWVIRETTITYENIQNVTVTQGPLERLFGIANVVVQTAGGGGAASHSGGAQMSTHVGLLEGLTNAHEVREMIQDRVRHCGHAGLGDEQPAHEPPRGPAAPWQPSAEHVAALRDIRDVLRGLTDRGTARAP